MRERLEYIRTLSRTNRAQNIIISDLHKEIFKTTVCLSCPAAIRQAVKRLKEYYNKTYA
jgi:hypothetical protein